MIMTLIIMMIVTMSVILVMMMTTMTTMKLIIYYQYWYYNYKLQHNFHKNDIRKLEANWKVIRDEGLSVLDKKTGGFIPEEENLRQQGDWKQFTMYQRGRKNAAACQKTPQTCAIIDTIHDATSCKRGQVLCHIV